MEGPIREEKETNRDKNNELAIRLNAFRSPILLLFRSITVYFQFERPDLGIQAWRMFVSRILKL
jgi:hypothetical protein